MESPKQTERRQCSKSAEGRLGVSKYLHDSSSRHTVPSTLRLRSSVIKDEALSSYTRSTSLDWHNLHQSVQDESTDIRVKKYLPFGRHGVETIRPNLQVPSLHWLRIAIHVHEHGAISVLRSLAARPCRTYSLNPSSRIPASSD